MLNSIKVGLGSLAIAGSILMAAPAQAATLHCNSTTYPNKVELSDDNVTFDTNLPDGITVCLKIGNTVTTAVTYNGGLVTNTDVFNDNGKLQGISYYAWGSYNPYPY